MYVQPKIGQGLLNAGSGTLLKCRIILIIGDKSYVKITFVDLFTYVCNVHVRCFEGNNIAE